MCGINAVIGGTRQDLNVMIEASTKRGYIQNVTEYKGAFVHFNWLPITDSKAPLQPFVVGDCAVWFNGYISNYKELAVKHDIELLTDCDTELLAKFLDLHKGKQLEELNGFFAILWHDGKEWQTICDRYGIKKLYLCNHEGKQFISSELKPLVEACGLTKSTTLVDEFKHSLGVMNLNTMYYGVRRSNQVPFQSVSPCELTYFEAKTELKRLFKQSIYRNQTTLTKGVFLSGGIDSGIIANYIEPDYTFSVDYVDSNFSEIANIKRNSKGIHYTVICNKELAREYIPKVVDLLTDPKVGSSYTNYAVTELASKFCTVVYSGAGGDEFFGGYPHRLRKEINDVISRTKYKGSEYKVSHLDYDLLYLRGILNIEDTIGGSFTLETRYPLLDNDLVNFALSLPVEYKLGKRILKDISGLDKEVLEARKRGFSNPHLNNDQWVNLFLLHPC